VKYPLPTLSQHDIHKVDGAVKKMCDTCGCVVHCPAASGPYERQAVRAGKLIPD